MADVRISHHIIVGARKLIWHNLSSENAKIGYVNKRKCEILATGSVSQRLMQNPYKCNVSTSRYTTMGQWDGSYQLFKESLPGDSHAKHLNPL